MDDVDSGESKVSWEKAKKEEKNRQSVIDGVPKSLPALTRARRVQEKASSVGFDWNSIDPIWKKIEEDACVCSTHKYYCKHSTVLLEGF